MSKKKNTGLRNILFVFFFIAIVVLGAIFTNQFQQTAYASGFIVKSITAPNYVTSNPALSDYEWRVVANILGSERIVYTLSPEEFQRFSGLSTSNDFTIDMQSFDETVNYDVVRETTIADYKYSYTKGGRFLDRTPPECPDGFSYQFIEYNNYGVANVRHCLAQQRFGFKGTLNEPSVKFRAKMSLSAKNIELVQDITSEDSTAVFNYEGDRLAQAQWSGSLVSGDPLPKTDNIVAVLQEGDVWYLITEDAWTNYQIAEANFVSIWESTITDDEKSSSDNLIDKLQTDINNYKNARTTYLNQQTSIPNANWEDRNDRDLAKLIVTSDTRLSVPEIVFDIRADWIGIEILSGVPDIQSISCSESSSGGSNLVDVEVKNIGNERGTFAFEKEACPSFKQSFSSVSERITLDAGETGRNTLELGTGAINTDVSEVCSIRVYDITDPDNQDVADVRCEQSRLKTCEPDEQRSEGLCVYECNEEGTNEKLLFCCDTQAPVFDPYTESYKCLDANVEICNDGIDNDGDGDIDLDDDDCPSGCKPIELFGIAILPNFGCLFNDTIAFSLQLLGIIVVILSGISVYYLMVALARRYRFKQNKAVFVIISMLVAVVLYLLLFEFLWWIIGIAIFFVIMRFVSSKIFQRILDRILPKKK